MLFTVLVIVHIIVSALLMVAILLQASKGGGLAGIGGGQSTAFLSGRQAVDTLVKATVFLSVLFALLSIALNIKGLHDTGGDKGIIETELEQSGGAPALPVQE
jgi:preprotein translocase subunit SecG